MVGERALGTLKDVGLEVDGIAIMGGRLERGDGGQPIALALLPRVPMVGEPTLGTFRDVGLEIDGIAIRGERFERGDGG